MSDNQSMKIPEVAVEAAVEAMLQDDKSCCECRHSTLDKHDVNPPCSTRRRAAQLAHAALEAAAPHMLMRGGDSYQTQYKQNELGEWREEAAK